MHYQKQGEYNLKKHTKIYYMEIWKDIPELEGKYQCSNYGMVRKQNKGP